jgi:putative selenate reductase
MSDMTKRKGDMRPLPVGVLFTWVFRELENDAIFGLPRSQFYSPRPNSSYAIHDMFGHYLATPIGPAAGPHTQLAQNIVCAWLSGGRFIELKTVQIMDELEIPRPCIDVEDEGYNVEWSQELKLEQSEEEYVKAWVLIHLLHRRLSVDTRPPFEAAPVGTVFNMSVGYNLEGIQSPRMTRFMDCLQDASAQIAEIRATLKSRFPELGEIPIPTQITNSVTLSTMHGCPPDEIERIARYLLEERGLHTTVKLNPTLLGKDRVMHILHDQLGYTQIDIPDRVFEHDLQYGRAVELIRTLKQVAAARGLTFGVKLSNTLAMANRKGTLPGDEMYMSGRALYPITMNLFHKLSQEFGGDLNVSYSAGADALNVGAILASGARPVTAATDLLKPGGYSRLVQWLENLEAEMRRQGAASLDELSRNKLDNLEAAAAAALADPRYKKSYFPFGLPKVESGLDLFDCIAAPCVEQCAVCQDVPEYAWLIAHGQDDKALEVILHRNPLPAVTGYVCTHLCQTRCTRNNYDQPVGIRDLKRFAAEQGKAAEARVSRLASHPARVAIVGSGPSGLAAAYFLALNGVAATVFEAREKPGGMLVIAPAFRLPPEVVRADIDRITGLGVEIRLNHQVAVPPLDLLAQGYDAVYLACGFQRDAALDIAGIEGQGVFTSLRFLEAVARGEKPELGQEVLVIGGGNTAMDAARTAQRLTGRPATVVYRRSQAEMPAEPEEVRDLLEEGNRLIELAAPQRIVLTEGRVSALECLRVELGEPGADGRRAPKPVPGSEFRIKADSIILAIGQQPDLGFLAGSGLTFGKDGAIVTEPESRSTAAGSVYAGGDVTRGPAIIIQACEDGRRAAEAICRQLGIEFCLPPAQMPALSEEDVIQVKGARARKVARHEADMLPARRRAGFDLVEQTLSEEAARAEAARCLQCSALCDKCVEVCPNRANYSYRVEPVRWTLPALDCRDGGLAVAGKEAFEVRQTRQILHVDDFCNECGDCATFCVHQGKPYKDKPRLFLEEADFLQTNHKAFYIEGNTIRRREDGQEARLAVQDGTLIFENAKVRIGLSPDFSLRETALKEPFQGSLSLRVAAEMAVILKGVTTSLRFLPATDVTS